MDRTGGEKIEKGVEGLKPSIKRDLMTFVQQFTQRYNAFLNPGDQCAGTKESVDKQLPSWNVRLHPSSPLEGPEDLEFAEAESCPVY